jgi:hypothetical protein
MSAELDLRDLHRPHEPDPAFVAALERRLEALLAGDAPTDAASGDNGSPVDFDFEPAVQRSLPVRRPFVSRIVLVAAAAALVVVAVGVVRWSADDPPAELSTSTDPPPAGSVGGWFAVATDDDETGGGGVYLVREGEEPRRVEVPGSDATRETCPAFTPDGSRLMFGRATGNRDDGFSDAELVIVSVGADGSVTPQNTIALEGMSGQPCAIWAPDGRWVAFGGPDSEDDGFRGSDGVWVVDTETGEIRRLDGYHPHDLEWRPGTDELAITGDRPANEIDDAPIDIYTVSTGDIRTVGDVQAANLTWSPDGTTIAFTHGENAADSGIWLVDADGTNVRQLTSSIGEAFHGIGVVWSPSGDLIAYQRTCAGCGEEHEVVLVTATDGDPDNPLGTEVVIAPARTQTADGSVWFPWSVTWSPDGAHLLYNAWYDTDDVELSAVVAVPVDPTQEPVVLVHKHPNVYVGTPWIPLQGAGGAGPMIQRQPADPADPSTAAPGGTVAATVPLDDTGPGVQPAVPFVGAWLSTDTDGSSRTMYIFGSSSDEHEIVMRGDVATRACEGGRSTITGTGRIQSPMFVIHQPEGLTCADGSEPAVPNGELGATTLTYDSESDTLHDASGVVWRREGATPTATAPAMPSQMWPQSSLDEVREAQELADAGDPASSWQVDPQLSSEEWSGFLRDPGAEIVERFLREELGWDAFMFSPYQGDDGDGASDGILRGVEYLRCAPDETNALYPTASCAPTIDELLYETVSLDLSQLGLRGAAGIWVVSGWTMPAPFTQTDPRVAKDEARARLEDFLAARVDGQGAERHVDGNAEVPLLYATTSGASYERYEIERVSAPRWPYGELEFKVRLYADGDETVVEQPIASRHVGGAPLILVPDAEETTENGQPIVPNG